MALYYTDSTWGIFNEDGALITNGQSFSVFVIQRHIVDLTIIQR